MYELQSHVGIMELPPIFFLITQGNLASACGTAVTEPFLMLTLSKLHFVLRLVEINYMKPALCGAVEGFAWAANMKFQIRDESPFPSCQAADYCFCVLPFLNLMSSSWLSSKDPELQQAVVKALGPAMGLPLHHKRHRDTVFDKLPCLLQQYEGGLDNLHVTMVRCRLGNQHWPLYVRVGVRTGTPCLSPDQFISLVDSQLKTDKKASHVASLSIFSGIIAADWKYDQSKRVDCCEEGHPPRTLLNVQGLDDVAWDLVAYIFKQSSLSSSQLKSKNHSSQDAEEEQSI
ncbi:LOW QUALITY PROTEIN: maestro heat-like repeat-containing protein family member 2B [Alligator sinensis]|uniref:LOW QUALITY PROTEIN: maestro heat-like repeat-containing protein family member 2B n=1 Tax=Alligator sinensis TaxID=38654 RepID=A0A3Q0G4Q3_ALLSI|nr:LOW QUALITY PROTEIN: maestro heat-like repeat-containing protein family member 2B [Alligator sinensis]